MIKAPERMPMSVIEAFVLKKESWIKSSTQKVLASLEVNRNIIDCKDVLFCGQTYQAMYTSEVKKITLTQTALLVPLKILPEALPLAIKKWYIKAAPEIIYNRVTYFAELMQVRVNSVRLTNASARWGSCDSKSDVRLNWRLVMLPPSLIDYIVVHELAHLIELNHSPNFWKIVESIIPGYKQCVKDTKKAGFLLQLFR